MAKVCPQRIINEAVRLLENYLIGETIADGDEIDNNIVELESLAKALYRDGIINIEEVND